MTGKRCFGGYGYAVGRKVKPHKRDCQRCGKTFKTNRLVAYCPPCFGEKRAERRARLES